MIIHARFKRADFSVWERTEKNSRYVGLCDKLQIFCSFFGVLPLAVDGKCGRVYPAIKQMASGV